MTWFQFGGGLDQWVGWPDADLKMVALAGASLRPIDPDTGITIPLSELADSDLTSLGSYPVSDAAGRIPIFHVSDRRVINLGATRAGDDPETDELIYYNVSSPAAVAAAAKIGGTASPFLCSFIGVGKAAVGQMPGLWVAPADTTLTVLDIRVRTVPIGGSITVELHVLSGTGISTIGPYTIDERTRHTTIAGLTSVIPVGSQVTCWVTAAGGSGWPGGDLAVTMMGPGADTPTTLAAPPAPGSVTVTTATLGKTVSWGAATGAAEYQLSSLVGQTHTILAVTTGTSYTDPTATAATVYEVASLNRDKASTGKQPVSGGGTGGSGSSPGAGSGSAAVTLPAGRTWLSGGSCAGAADGTFGAFRSNQAIEIAGTWLNDYNGRITQDTILPGKEYGSPKASGGSWTKPLDIAVGGMWYLSKGQTSAAAAAGAYNSQYAQVAANLKTNWGSRDQRLMFIRIAHEFNGDWFDWETWSGDAANFVTSWRLYYAAIKAQLPNCNVVWCPANSGNTTVNAVNCWPGDSYVDFVGIDLYNNWPHTTDSASFLANKVNATKTVQSASQPVGIEQWRLFAEAHGKGLMLNEWANCGNPSDGGGGSDNTYFMGAMNSYFRSNAWGGSGSMAGKFIGEVFFNYYYQFQIFYPPGTGSTIQPNNANTYKALTHGV